MTMDGSRYEEEEESKGNEKHHLESGHGRRETQEILSLLAIDEKCSIFDILVYPNQ